MSAHTHVQQVLDELVATKELIGVVAEIQDQHQTWFGSAGLADITTGRERTPGEYLHAGSIGKSFTAATVLQLVANGTLSLDDSVEKWLPGVADASGNAGHKLIVRDLLQNTSGLYVTGLSPITASRQFTRSAVEKYRNDVWTTAQLLELAVSQPPIGEPGERFAYANGGFYFLGAIIEAATGGYADAVRRTVLDPLGLNRTYVRPPEATTYPDPYPRSYSNKFLKEGVDPAAVTEQNWQMMMEDPELAPLDMSEFNSSLGFSAGNIVSTTSELIRFYRAMLDGELLPPDLHREMWTTVSTEAGNWVPGSRYGLGVVELQLDNGVTLRGGLGSMPGSETLVFGDDRSMIAIHTNSDERLPALAKIIAAEFGAAPFRLSSTSSRRR